MLILCLLSSHTLCGFNFNGLIFSFKAKSHSFVWIAWLTSNFYHTNFSETAVVCNVCAINWGVCPHSGLHVHSPRGWLQWQQRCQTIRRSKLTSFFIFPLPLLMVCDTCDLGIELCWLLTWLTMFMCCALMALIDGYPPPCYLIRHGHCWWFWWYVPFSLLVLLLWSAFVHTRSASPSPFVIDFSIIPSFHFFIYHDSPLPHFHICFTLVCTHLIGCNPTSPHPISHPIPSHPIPLQRILRRSTLSASHRAISLKLTKLTTVFVNIVGGTRPGVEWYPVWLHSTSLDFTWLPFSLFL